MAIFQCVSCMNQFDTDPAAGLIACPFCGTSIDTNELDFELPQGYVLGGFEIIRLIGKGGSGNVYLATQISMQRPVALKVLLKNQTRDYSALMQFLKEVKNLGKIQHQGVVTALDAGESNGLFFLAMQYVNGVTLDVLTDKHGVVPVTQAIEYVIDIAMALKYVWDKYRMFHRDIKPSNIMVNEDDEAVLLDLGIAQSRGEMSMENGTIQGSPYYMSPEQIQGHALDWRTDMYSLGVTFYNLITGVPPFDDPDDVMNILKMHLSNPVPNPSERNPRVEVQSQVVDILKKMLEKDPKKRYPSWDSFIDSAEVVLAQIRSKRSAPTVRVEVRSNPKNVTLPPRKRIYTATRKKQSTFSGLIKLVNLLIILAAGIGVAYFFLAKNNTSAADAFFQQALRKVKENEYTLASASSFFRQAKAASEKMGVSQEKRLQIDTAYEDFKLAYDARIKEIRALEGLTKKTLNALSGSNTKLQTIARSSNMEKEALETEINALLAQGDQYLAELAEFKPKDQRTLDELDRLKIRIEGFKRECESVLTSRQKRIAASNKGKAVEAAPQVDISDFLEQIEQYKMKTRKEMVSLIRAKKFQEINGMLILPDNLWKSDKAYEQAIRQAQNWVKTMRKYCAAAKKANDKLGELEGKTKRPTMEQLKQLIPEYDELFPYLILNGYFNEARSIADDFDKEEASAFTTAYLEDYLRRALKKAKAGDNSSLKKLDSAFHELPEYKELKERLSEE